MGGAGGRGVIAEDPTEATLRAGACGGVGVTLPTSGLFPECKFGLTNGPRSCVVPTDDSVGKGWTCEAGTKGASGEVGCKTFCTL